MNDKSANDGGQALPRRETPLMTQLNGSVAVVTGAGSGIGRALSLALASSGSSVVGADLDRARLAETDLMLAATGAAHLTQVTDVRDPAAVAALAHATIERFGSADIVCSNAGVMRPGAIWEQPPEVWDRVIGVNLQGS